MPATTLPPFPNNVRTHPLVVIDLDLLKAGDASEIERLWGAATSIGFWYLKNHGADKEVDDMFDVGADAMALPFEEKMKFEQTDGGPWFGYRKAGTYAVDATGKPDSAESFNISKDDALAFPEVVHATYPAPWMAAMSTVLRPFVCKSLQVNDTIIRIFNDRLGLPEGTLERLHSDEELSFSGARVIRIQPMPEQAVADRPMFGAHTDFGSITILHNRLGGLQVMPPGQTEWFHVKPLPGHAICNIGDALAIFSGGILQSNMHRVVRAPGDQGKHERWSTLFFNCPGNSRVLRPFMEDSSLIADAVQKHPNQNFHTGQTAGEWFTRRVKHLNIKDGKVRKSKKYSVVPVLTWLVINKGPETWMACKGTEHTPTAA